MDGRTWSPLKVETNDIANLAKAVRRLPEANTVMARITINSETDALRAFEFGYSDRLQLYLNGELVYAGAYGWTSRDYAFYGKVGVRHGGADAACRAQ